jgi:hypothetical protein
MKQAHTYSAMLDEATSRRAELNGQDMGQGRKRVIRAALRCIRLRAARAIAFGAIATMMEVIPTQAAVRVSFPPNPGPPFYALLERPPLGEIFRDGDWAAIPFVRDPSCIPPDFNLLETADLEPAFGTFGPPRSFLCTLTVNGFGIFKNGPPPIDPAPIQTYYSGLGNAPVWFVLWADLQVAISDDVLTIGELQALPSLLVGSASFFEAIAQPGTLRPQGFGNGKIEIVALGTLGDGRSFIFTSREMGVDQVSIQRHTKIEFK